MMNGGKGLASRKLKLELKIRGRNIQMQANSIHYEDVVVHWGKTNK